MTALVIFTGVRDADLAVDRSPVRAARSRSGSRRATARPDDPHPLLRSADGVLRLHDPGERAAQRARSIRRRGVRAGREQRRRDRRAARVRRSAPRAGTARSPTSPVCATTSACSCSSASARRSASLRWRWSSCPRSPAPGVHLRFVLEWRDPAIRTILRLSGWTAGYVITNQLAQLFILVLANNAAGNVSAYVYAFTFYVVPHGLLAVSIMTTMTPNLARRARAGDREGLRHEFGVGLRYIIVLVLPASVLFVVLAQPMLAVIVRHQFTAHDAVVTADTLQAFAISLVPFSVYLYVMRGVLRARRTRARRSCSTRSRTACNVVLALALFPSFGVQGLALALERRVLRRRGRRARGAAPAHRRGPRRRGGAFDPARRRRRPGPGRRRGGRRRRHRTIVARPGVPGASAVAAIAGALGVRRRTRPPALGRADRARPTGPPRARLGA